jgi:predicted PurR-regulated permease PerM
MVKKITLLSRNAITVEPPEAAKSVQFYPIFASIARMADDSLVRDVGRTLGGYVTGQIKVAAILACLYAIGYAIAGVPFWPLLGAISGAVNVIPIIGSLIGVALTAYVVLLNDGTLWNYLGVLITFVVVQGLEGFWITPRILGHRVGLSPLYVFFAVLLGGAMFGPIGVLFAVPVLAVLGVLWRHATKRRATV